MPFPLASSWKAIAEGNAVSQAKEEYMNFIASKKMIVSFALAVAFLITAGLSSSSIASAQDWRWGNRDRDFRHDDRDERRRDRDRDSDRWDDWQDRRQER